MSSYFIGKLSEINYRIAIHEGNANQRLASEAGKLILLYPSEIPEVYRNDFIEFREILNETIQGLPSSGLIPTRIKGIRNRTAAKYIKLLIDIEEYIKNE